MPECLALPDLGDLLVQIQLLGSYRINRDGGRLDLGLP